MKRFFCLLLLSALSISLCSGLSCAKAGESVSNQDNNDIEDVAILWQNEQDEYIDFLDGETFEEALYSTHISSELIFLRGGDMMLSANPSSPVHITLLARSRRFAKLLMYVNQAKESGNLDSVISTIDTTVKRFTQERIRITEELFKLMEEELEAFDPNLSQEAQKEIKRKFGDLINGVNVMGLDIPGDALPIGMAGTNYGAVACTFLLGLTEKPQALRTLLDIVDYDDEPFDTKITEFLKILKTQKVGKATYENQVVMADAIDRIIVASLESKTVSGNALAVAQEYIQWRQQHGLPEQRETVEVFAYDSERTPYHLPGAFLGVGEDAHGPTMALELPMVLGEPEFPYTYDEGLIEPIIEFARRFQAALDEDKHL